MAKKSSRLSSATPPLASHHACCIFTCGGAHVSVRARAQSQRGKVTELGREEERSVFSEHTATPTPVGGDLLSHGAPFIQRVTQWRTGAHTHNHTQPPEMCCSEGEQHPTPKSGNRMMKEALTSWNRAGYATRRTQSAQQNPNDGQGGRKKSEISRQMPVYLNMLCIKA